MLTDRRDVRNLYADCRICRLKNSIAVRSLTDWRNQTGQTRRRFCWQCFKAKNQNSQFDRCLCESRVKKLIWWMLIAEQNELTRITINQSVDVDQSHADFSSVNSLIDIDQSRVKIYFSYRSNWSAKIDRCWSRSCQNFTDQCWYSYGAMNIFDHICICQIILVECSFF